jgi:hypothetical protein
VIAHVFWKVILIFIFIFMQQLHGVPFYFLTFWTQLKNNEHFNAFGQIVDYEIFCGLKFGVLMAFVGAWQISKNQGFIFSIMWLVCQNPFYKTSSIPKLLNLHIFLIDITTMLFSCFMGLLLVFIYFNFFWIEYEKWVIS